MEMSHLEVLGVWYLSDALNPRSPCSSPAPTWDQAQQWPQLSDAKDGVRGTARSVVMVLRSPCHQQGLCSHQRWWWHQGRMDCLCPPGTRQQASCNWRRIFKEKTLIFHDAGHIPRASLDV